MKPPPAPRELVLVARHEVGLRATLEGVFSDSGFDVDSLDKVISAAGARIEPLFGISESLLEFRAERVAAESGGPPVISSRYYKVAAPDAALEALAQRVRSLPAVDAAFIKPGVEVPVRFSGKPSLPVAPADEVTQDLSGDQVYLGKGGGINAIAAGKLPGGDGLGIRIIDIEGAWRFSHEDLLENQGGVVGGAEPSDLRWRNHGTAVLGILSADRNTVGINGICPGAHVRAISVFGQPGSHDPVDAAPAAAIRQAADLLDAGDIMLIELQAPGPGVNFKPNKDQRGYIPIEWWPDNLAAIQYAVAKGIIVVEAAGNGASNLDDSIFQMNPGPDVGPFPPEWRNPFRRNNIDSGTIVVGAGAPLEFINNSNLGPECSRLDFSNFGTIVDAQGWGGEVTTCGYGDLQAIDEDRFYTSDFGGTSSAAPMVAGAVACIQGMLRAANKPLLTSATARALLRMKETGLPQTDAPGRPASQRIGNRPDVMKMAQELGLVNEANEALEIGAAAASSPAKLTPS